MATERFYPGTLANQQSILAKLDALARQEMTQREQDIADETVLKLIEEGSL